MSLKVAIQMDPIGGINIDADSTFVLALEAQARGHALWHYAPADLALITAGGRTRALARAQPLSVRRNKGAHADLGAPATIDLAEMDVVLLRQDPPFDMAYVTTTHILDHVHPRTLVVNDPTAVRNAPEKLLNTRFPGLMPPTLITHDRAAIEAFRAEHRDIILKPLFGNGGAGVFHLAPGDENLSALLETFALLARDPIVCQRYLPEIRAGDKRIILIEGEPAGAINRVPLAGEARANMHAGGRPEPLDLTARDLAICAAIGPTLRELGLVFVGIDVIGDYLTEINVTSPTGLQEIARFTGAHLETTIWDAIERRRAAVPR